MTSIYEIMHNNKTDFYIMLDDNGEEILASKYYSKKSCIVPLIYPRFKSNDIVRVTYPPQLYEDIYDSYQKKTNGFNPEYKKLYNLKCIITPELLLLKDIYNNDNINYTIKINDDEYMTLIDEKYISPIYDEQIYKINDVIELNIFACRYHMNSDQLISGIIRDIKRDFYTNEIIYDIEIKKGKNINLYTHEIKT